MKTWLIGIALLLFVISHTIYTYFLANIKMTYLVKNNWRCYDYLGILVLIYIFQKTGTLSWLQSQLIEITFFIVFFTLVITLLTNYLIVKNPYHIMAIVDAGTILVTIMVLLSAQRHGFNKK